MPKSIPGVFAFAVVAVITVIVGLAIYNRAAMYFPFLRIVTGEA